MSIKDADLPDEVQRLRIARRKDQCDGGGGEVKVRDRWRPTSAPIYTIVAMPVVLRFASIYGGLQSHAASGDHMKNKIVLGSLIAASMMTAPAYGQSAAGERAREAAWDERGQGKYFFGGLTVAAIVGIILAILLDDERGEDSPPVSP